MSEKEGRAARRRAAREGKGLPGDTRRIGAAILLAVVGVLGLAFFLLTRGRNLEGGWATRDWTMRFSLEETRDSISGRGEFSGGGPFVAMAIRGERRGRRVFLEFASGGKEPSHAQFRGRLTDGDHMEGIMRTGPDSTALTLVRLTPEQAAEALPWMKPEE